MDRTWRMNEYSKLNDWQINQLVHNYYVCNGEFNLEFTRHSVRWINNNYDITYKRNEAITKIDRDYFEDKIIFHIIRKYKINIQWRDSVNLSPLAIHEKLIAESADISRAVLECYLMIKEEGNLKWILSTQQTN